MLAHCVNPNCCEPSHSFLEGRLFQFEIVSISVSASDDTIAPFDEKPERQTAQFWLCGRCAANMTLLLEPVKGLRLIPLADVHESGQSTTESAPSEEGFCQPHNCLDGHLGSVHICENREAKICIKATGPGKPRVRWLRMR